MVLCLEILEGFLYRISNILKFCGVKQIKNLKNDGAVDKMKGFVFEKLSFGVRKGNSTYHVSQQTFGRGHLGLPRQTWQRKSITVKHSRRVAEEEEWP